MTPGEVIAKSKIMPDNSALEIAEYWCSTKEEVIEFLKIYQDFIGPIE